MCQALMEIMEPEINKIKENVKEEGIRNVVAALREAGQAEEDICQIISKAYHISYQEVGNYL